MRSNNGARLGKQCCLSLPRERVTCMMSARMYKFQALEQSEQVIVVNLILYSSCEIPRGCTSVAIYNYVDMLLRESGRFVCGLV